MAKNKVTPTKKPTTQGLKSNTANSFETNDIEKPYIAKPSTRLVAIIYDGMLILALLFLVGTIMGVIGTLLFLPVGTTSQEAQVLPVWYQNLVMTPSFVLTLVGFYGIFWRRSGQTLGMQTWRLKTINTDGQLLTWQQTFKRILSACVLPIFCGFVGWVIHGSRNAMLFSAFFGFLFNYLFCLLNRRGLAIHDILSNTITLKMPKIHHESLWQSFKNRKKKSDNVD